MKKLEKVILYYIKKSENEFVSLLGTEFDSNNISWDISFPKGINYEIVKLPFSPVLMQFLRQYIDGEISNDLICNTIISLKDSDYIKTSNHNSFSFKLSDKGYNFYSYSELSRDLPIGF